MTLFAMRRTKSLGPRFRRLIPGYERPGASNDIARGCSASSSSSFDKRDRRIVKRLLGVVGGALATCGSIIYLVDRSLMASDLVAEPPSYPWGMDKFFASLDHSSIRRGWQVYRSVCATCHSVNFLKFQDLVGVSHTEREMKAIAAEYEIEDGPNDAGDYYKRPGKLQDAVPAPFANEEAARAANNGSYPVDLSYVINARKSGKDYVFSLLTGYNEAPAGVELAEGQLFNAYFPGGAISMPELIQDGVVDYEDGTPATSSQIAKDVVEFLTWCANRQWDERKVAGTKGLGICALLIVAMMQMYKTRWTTIKRTRVFHVPKNKC